MVNISKDLILRIIFTLKQLDVRGWDSMDSLVGVVNLLESIIKQTEKQKTDEENETEG